MNLAAVRTLVETYTNHDLQQAEAQLLEGEPLTIDVQGEDEGEQLTHILAALWVRQHMAEQVMLCRWRCVRTHSAFDRASRDTFPCSVLVICASAWRGS